MLNKKLKHMFKNILLAIAFIVITPLYAQTQDVKSESSQMKSFVDALLKKMTLEEKLGN
ncbi:MAG: hypothetical protein WKF85_11465 [Chitinophagaceae bacterium]